MQIWVDADACPNVIKDVLFRAAERTGMMVTLVANQIIHTPPSKFLRTLRVVEGLWIAQRGFDFGESAPEFFDVR